MQRSSLDILLFLSSMGPTIKIRIPITRHKANEKIDGITAYFAISKTVEFMDTLFVVLCISIFVDNDKFFLNQNKKRRKISFS